MFDVFDFNAQVQGFAASGAGRATASAEPPSLRQAFSTIVRSEGMAALWKGNGATIVHRLPYSAINFWAYERLTVGFCRMNTCGDQPVMWTCPMLGRRDCKQTAGSCHREWRTLQDQALCGPVVWCVIRWCAIRPMQELWNAALPPDQRGRSHSMDVARRLTAGGAAGMCACTVVRSLLRLLLQQCEFLLRQRATTVLLWTLECPLKSHAARHSACIDECHLAHTTGVSTGPAAHTASRADDEQLLQWYHQQPGDHRAGRGFDGPVPWPGRHSHTGTALCFATCCACVTLAILVLWSGSSTCVLAILQQPSSSDGQALQEAHTAEPALVRSQKRSEKDGLRRPGVVPLRMQDASVILAAIRYRKKLCLPAVLFSSV